MSYGAVLLAVAAGAQTVLLAWIAAWQARAASEVRKLNGSVVEAVSQLGPTLVSELEAAGAIPLAGVVAVPNVRSPRDLQ